MKLPTELGKRLLVDYFKARMEEPAQAYLAVGDFQRMALVGSVEDAVAVTKTWFKPQHRVIKAGSAEDQAIQLCYKTVKQDVLGLAMDALITVVQSTNSTKDKITAAAVLNDLFGDKQVIQDSVLTDKLVMNLVGDR